MTPARGGVSFDTTGPETRAYESMHDRPINLCTPPQDRAAHKARVRPSPVWLPYGPATRTRKLSPAGCGITVDLLITRWHPQFPSEPHARAAQLPPSLPLLDA